MDLRQAFRRLSGWKNRHDDTREKSPMDMDGSNSLPVSEPAANINKPSVHPARVAFEKTFRSLLPSIIRLQELFDSSFRAKVLLPVVGSMAVALAATFFVVDNRISGQSEQEARNDLATANAVVRYSQDFRRNDLMLRFHNLPNEPLWRQVFQFGASKELHNTLSQLMQMQRVDILFYASNRGKILDIEKNDPRIPVPEFQAAAMPVLQLALRGDEKADTVCVGGKLYDIVTVPAYNQENNEQIGVLILGSELGDAAVQELSKLAQSQIALVANGHITASTLPGSDVAQFASVFKAAAPATEGDDSMSNVKPVVLNGTHYYYIAERFASLDPNSNLGCVLLRSREQSLASLAGMRSVLSFLGALSIAFCVMAVWFFVNRITEPLRELKHGAEAVGQGDFNRRVPVRSRDECGQLAMVFNGMTENIRQSRSQLEKTVESLKTAQAQLVQSEKLSAVGKFVAGVAHELNNPLTAVVGFSEILGRTAEGKNSNYAEMIFKAALRCKRIVQSLLSFARREQTERKLVSMNDLLEMVLEIIGYALRTGNIEVVTQLQDNLPLALVDTSKIQQVLLNLINNAKEAIETGGQPGRIEIVTETQESNIRVSIRDNGPGIPREHLRRIFDPFFTTKEVGKGTGLGLSLCYGYIQEHNGTITANSQLGKGATFVIELPIAEKAEAPHETAALPPAEKPDPTRGKGKRVLVIDDEKAILNLIQGDFTLRGYEVEVAEDGATALNKLENERFDLAFCDWRMPGLTGREIYEQVRRTHPQFCRRVVFITGDVVNDQMREFLEREKRPCLAKPFTLAELHATVDDLLKTV
jgi:two-component system, NtrC family, sensor kinase